MDLTETEKRLEAVRSRPDGLILAQRTSSGHVLVVKSDGQVILYFGDARDDTTQLNLSGVMSRVLLRDPLHLLGVYTRIMMLALAWRPEPKQVYLLGFGGGRMPMVLNAHFPDVVTDSTETEPVVVRLAQQFFGIGLDDRMRVHVEDGRSYLEERPESKYDIIWVDCFSGSGQHPLRLSTTHFYQLCREHLEPTGVVVTNLSVHDPLLSRKVSTFGNSFGVSAAFRDESCCVLFGWDDTSVTLDRVRDTAKRLEDRHRFGFPFAVYAEQLTPLSGAEDLPDLVDAAAVTELRPDDTIFLGVSRNAACPCGSGRKFKQCHGSRNWAS